MTGGKSPVIASVRAGSSDTELDSLGKGLSQYLSPDQLAPKTLDACILGQLAGAESGKGAADLYQPTSHDSARLEQLVLHGVLEELGVESARCDFLVIGTGRPGRTEPAPMM
jgi:hypothetical protein